MDGEQDGAKDCFEDDLDLLEDIIYQNHLNDRFYPDDGRTDGDALDPPPFDEEPYNPDYYTAQENRLVSVRHRLQKRLAAKGIKPSQTNPAGRPNHAVSVGKTLLQQLMEANTETLCSKLKACKAHRAQCQLLGREFKFAKGNSQALPSQYTFRVDPADNARRRENVHHAGR